MRVLPGVRFTGIADKGMAVGRTAEGEVVFAEGPAPGDVADVQVLRKRKGVWQGRVLAYHRFSADRVTPACAHFGACGGCKWQHLSYAAQLKHKEDQVRQALVRIGKVDASVLEPIVGSAQPFEYRNKLEFSFGTRRWLTTAEIAAGQSNEARVLGFHKAGAFDKLIDIRHCLLQPSPSNELREGIRRIAEEMNLAYYDNRTHTGFLRQMVIRTARTGQTMLIMGFGRDEPALIASFLDEVADAFPGLTTIIYAVNTKRNDYLFDLEMKTFSGPGYIEERLGDLVFKIGPKSFFQTHTRQAEELYGIAREFAGLTGEETVYDLYTGTGSIALYLARDAGRVVGIETIEAAIADARENAIRNGIENVRFYAGDVRDVLTPAFAGEHGRPDVLVTDPPRSGMHPDVVDFLLRLEAPRIVYVSCNPATQARDIALLSSKYDLVRARPVDMFPHTHHVENVALLEIN